MPFMPQAATPAWRATRTVVAGSVAHAECRVRLGGLKQKQPLLV